MEPYKGCRRQVVTSVRPRWTFPGGFVDLGESVQDAARRARETKEAIEVRAFAAEDLRWDELALWSTEQALRAVLGLSGRPGSARA